MLVAALALSGCGAPETRPGRESAAAVSRTVPAEVSAKPSPGNRSAAVSAGAGVDPARAARPADPWLNLNVHVYGLSHHTDREGIRRRGVDNEVNLGLGLSYEFHNDDDGVAFFEAGFYEDSGRNWAKLVGPGYQFKLGDRWRLGAALLLIDSRTYNFGRVFIAPIPLLTYDLGIVKLNAIYAPRFQQYNNFAVFGFYLSIPLKQ